MEILIFRTDIKSKKKVKSVKTVLNNHADILKWTIDLDDIDNVLRIEANDDLTEEGVVRLVKPEGFFIEPLMY